THVTVGFAPLAPGSFSNSVVLVSNGGASTNTLSGIGMSPPLLLSPKAIAGDFIFSFVTVPGRTYLVQYKDALNNAFWQTLESSPGDGTTLSVTNLISTNPHRFFGVSVQ